MTTVLSNKESSLQIPIWVEWERFGWISSHFGATESENALLLDSSKYNFQVLI